MPGQLEGNKLLVNMHSCAASLSHRRQRRRRRIIFLFCEVLDAKGTDRCDPKGARNAREILMLPTMTPLIAALREPSCYPHPVEHLHVVETHISWIVLTGPYAYKIKKPLSLGFLDFSSLQARLFYCDEELRLNRRLAPDLYLEVVPLTGSLEQPRIGGQGQAIEYAVKMRQFREEDLLDRVQARGELLPAHIDVLARQIAAFHAACDRAPAGGMLGSPESSLQSAQQNFEQIATLPSERAEQPLIERLRRWTDSQGEALRPSFEARQRDGFVRECHGDLHLGNMFLEDGEPRLFDCLEFNPNLRWIDVMSETAFLVMDLYHRNHRDLARRFLNAYLERTGDYAGLATLPFYLVYRAMVRAKVALIRSGQSGVSEQERQLDLSESHHLLQLAKVFSAPRPLWIVLTHGLSGSGKSFYTQQLLQCCDAIRIRSDVERKRLHGLPSDGASGSALGAGLYTPEATQHTYEHLAALAAAIVATGWPVIVDAAFLERPQRDLFKQPALSCRVPLLILDFRVPEMTLRKRVSERAIRGSDPSEATLAVLERQIRDSRPLSREESPSTIAIGDAFQPAPNQVAQVLADRAGAAPFHK